MKNKTKTAVKVLVCTVMALLLSALMCTVSFAEQADTIVLDESVSILLGCGIFSIVAALIIVLVMKSGMKRTSGTGSAGDYLDRESVDISLKTDRFMYSTLTKVKKPEPQNKRN